MRGYVATVLGGLAGFLAAYVSGGKLLGLVLMTEDGARMCESAADPYACDVALQNLGLATVVVGVVVASALASAVVLRLIRAEAIRETGVAVVPMAALVLGLVFVVPWEQTTGQWYPWLGVSLILCALACFLALARRLGLAWHRRRTAPPSQDA